VMGSAKCEIFIRIELARKETIRIDTCDWFWSVNSILRSGRISLTTLTRSFSDFWSHLHRFNRDFPKQNNVSKQRSFYEKN
jgi:hypothetical protein